MAVVPFDEVLFLVDLAGALSLGIEVLGVVVLGVVVSVVAGGVVSFPYPWLTWVESVV